MNTHPVIHPRPLPAGNLVHRSSHTFSDSSSSSLDHRNTSPLAHKTLKRDRDNRQSTTAVGEDEREVSFELNPPSPSRDRSDELKTLGLGWPSHFPTLPSRDASFVVKEDEPVATKSDQKILGLGFNMVRTTTSNDRHKVAVQSDQESGKSSPPPAYGRAPMLKEEGSSSLAVHTPPTQDIEHGCSASSSQEDTVESMLDLPHSTITRRRRAVEAAATAFGLQIESSPEPDHVVQEAAAGEAGQSDIGQQLIDLKRQLESRDKDLALTARMAQAILRRHEELVAALPVDIKVLIPDLNSISTIDVHPISPLTRKRTNTSSRFTGHPTLPSPTRSRSPMEAGLVASFPSSGTSSRSGSPDLPVGSVVPKGNNHRRTKSAYVSTLASAGLSFAEVRQQEADDRLAKMEQALADARDSEEAQRKNAARLSRDFQKLQRDYDRLEAQAVQAAGESSGSAHLTPLRPTMSEAKTVKGSRHRSSSSYQSATRASGSSRVKSHLSPLRDEDEVETACGSPRGVGVGFGWGPNRYPQYPPDAGPLSWESPAKPESSGAQQSPYTAKPERPTVLRLRRLRAAQGKATGKKSTEAPIGFTTPVKAVPSPLSREAACPPAPRLGAMATPGASSDTQRELRVASSRSDFVPPPIGSLFSPSAASQRTVSEGSQPGSVADEPAPPMSSTVTRGRRPRVVRTSSILVQPDTPGRSSMKDLITASVRRRKQGGGLEFEVEVEAVSDESSEAEGNVDEESPALSNVCAESRRLAKGKDRACEDADDEDADQISLTRTSPNADSAGPSGRARHTPDSRPSSSIRSSPSQRALISQLARRRRIKWVDTVQAFSRETHGRRLLPRSPSPQEPPHMSDEDDETAIATPTPRRGSRAAQSSSHRSLRVSEQRSHPYLRPLALPLAQGLRTSFPVHSPAVLRHRRPHMPTRPHSDSAVLGHRRRISSPGRELMLQIELRQREERHRRRVPKPARRPSEEEHVSGGLLSIPSKLINDVIILLGLILEWLEVSLVIVYRVFVQARNGQRPNGAPRMWAKRKRYYF